MNNNNRVKDGLAVIAAFLQSDAGRAIRPENIERTVEAITRWLRAANLELNVSNMSKAWSAIQQTVLAVRPETVEVEVEDDMTDEEVTRYAAQIESWTSSELRENLKSPEIAAAIERVLDAKSKQKPKTKPVQKVSKPKPPARTAEEIAVLKLTSAQIKQIAAAGGAKAAGMERILQGLAAKEAREAQEARDRQEREAQARRSR